MDTTLRMVTSKPPKLITHYVSAIAGFSRTGECRARKRDFYRMYYAPPPPGYPPAPPGPPGMTPSR